MKVISMTNNKLVCAMLLLLAIFQGCCFIPVTGEIIGIQKRMKEELKKNYGKKFVVETPYLIEHSGIGNQYEAKAYPKDNPEIKFTVTQNTREDGQYSDDYLQMLWQYQGMQELSDILKTSYGHSFIIFVYNLEYYGANSRNMNSFEVLHASNGNAELYIKYVVFTDNMIDKKVESEIIYKILDMLMLKNNLKKYRLIVGYAPSASKNSYYFKENIKDGRSFKMLFEDKALTAYIDVHKKNIDETGIGNVNSEYVAAQFKTINDVSH